MKAMIIICWIASLLMGIGNTYISTVYSNDVLMQVKALAWLIVACGFLNVALLVMILKVLFDKEK